MMEEVSPPVVNVPGLIRVRSAADGSPLHFRHWVPAGSPRGWLLTLHGIQSHSGWYEFSGSLFAKAGWNVRIPDRRGSGLNTGQRGDAPGWQRLVNDVVHFLQDIQEERTASGLNVPVVLSGISWGAKLALKVAIDSPALLDGLVLITPGIFSRINPTWWDRGRLVLARALRIRKRRIPIPLNDPRLFSGLPEPQRFIQADPLALHDMTLSFLFASLELDHRLQQVRELQVPGLLLLAEQDRIIDNQKTIRYLNSIAQRGCKIKIYPQVQHTLELDRCREEFVSDWLDWSNSVVRKME